ncbi:MAG: hypothetical protein A4S16_03875 [Proteobacteria bacterium SG_bin6]|nr:MAG: hypothetical protein A4S16_03875 [Proteobacteria bacterium SG_bin6]
MLDEIQAPTSLPDLPPGWRPFRIARVADESSVIRSFYLEPADGGGLDPAAAGQHLPIRLTIPGSDDPVIRTYTISCAPVAGYYRLSVRKLGLASTYLHELAAPGTIIGAKPPAGDFIIDDQAAHPAVLVAAGVGITPLLAMLSHLVAGEGAGRPMRPVTLFYAARSIEERGFDAELAALAARASGKLRLVRVLQLTDGTEAGRDYEESGFLRSELFPRYLGFGRHDFYLCGPPPFMQAVYGALRALGVADSAIHAEAFGPASLIRTGDAAAPLASRPVAATGEEVVTFNPTGTQAHWKPGDGSLLELAEAKGLKPDYGCREGACGACKCKLVAGQVAYFRETSAAHDPDEVLICSAVPASRGVGSPAVVLALG